MRNAYHIIVEALLEHDYELTEDDRYAIQQLAAELDHDHDSEDGEDEYDEYEEFEPLDEESEAENEDE